MEGALGPKRHNFILRNLNSLNSMKEAAQSNHSTSLSSTNSERKVSFLICSLSELKMYYNSIYLVDCNKNIEK